MNLHRAWFVTAFILLLSAPIRMDAQAAPKIFYACYVPSSGTVYRIKESGLPPACTFPSHVPFSWTDGLPGFAHGALNGLLNDDHPQYVLVTGTRSLTGSLGAGGFKITGLGAATTAGDAVRFEQAVKVGDAFGGDVVGTYLNLSVARILGRPLASTVPTDGQVLTWRSATSSWTPSTPSPGASGTPLNTPGTLVQRDATTSGFAAGPVDLAQLNVSGNTAIGGSAAVSANATIGGSATVSANAAIGGSATVSGNATVGGSAVVNGPTSLTDLSASGNATVGGNASVGGNAAVGGSATVSGNAAIGGSATVSGSARVDGPTSLADLSASGNASVGGNATVAGTAAVGGNVTVGGSATVSGTIASGSGFRFPDGTVQTTAASGGGGTSDHGALTGLTDDDHPQYLLNGGRFNRDPFVLIGRLGEGAILPNAIVAGPGLVWYPRKGAFRAGHAEAAEWDDANIGIVSVGLGSSAEASGNSSVALGSSRASGQFSTAIGGGIASGDFSVAVARASTNGHLGSFAFGDNSAGPGSEVRVNTDNSFVVRAQNVWFGRSGDQPSSPAGYLTAAGVIASTSGGFRFPDGTVQSTAAVGGGSGTTGQNSESLFGTLGLTVSTGTFTVVPGLTSTVTVPANSVVIISTDGGAQTTSTSTTGFSSVDVAILVDGAPPPNGGYRRLICDNSQSVTTQFVNWSMQLAMPLSPGSHQIQVGTRLAAGTSAVVSGDNDSVLQGTLTVTFLKR